MHPNPFLERLKLVKGEERFLITYAPGSEPRVSEHLYRMVENPDLNFNHADLQAVLILMERKRREYEKF